MKNNCMKTFSGICLSVLSVLIIAGCAKSSKPMKQLPEATVRPTQQQQQQQAVPEELSVVAVQSKYLLRDSTLTKVYLYVDAYKGKNAMMSEEFARLYNLNYVIYSDYGTRDRLGYGNVKLDASNVSSANGKIVVTFEIKNPNKESGVLL